MEPPHTRLRICTYNLNSLQHVKRHQSPKPNTIGSMLAALDADIVCLQENKLSASHTRPHVFESLARVPGWDSYFALTFKGGYSGVCTFARTAATTVRAAEDGLLRILTPQNPVAAAAQCVAAAAAAEAQGGNGSAPQLLWPSEIVFPEAELRAMFTADEAVGMERDGRCVITDHGLFVLFNLYMPACTGWNGAEQVVVKRNIWRAVLVRARALLAAGRHVIVAGDLNVMMPWWRSQPPAAFFSRTKASTQQQQQQQQQQQTQGQQHGGLLLHDNEEEEEQYPPWLAHYREGKPKLPASGMGHSLLGMIAPLDDLYRHRSSSNPPTAAEVAAAALAATAAAAAEAGGDAAGSSNSFEPPSMLLIDTTKHLNPGIEMFSYPDAKRPGQMKLRPPYTAWGMLLGIRNESKGGGRGDYVLVADAGDYAAWQQKLAELQQQQPEQGPAAAASSAPPSPAPPPQQQQQQQQQQPRLTSCLHSACILRELRWTDHAPVILELSLPPAAAAALKPCWQPGAVEAQARLAAAAAVTEAAAGPRGGSGGGLACEALPNPLPCPQSTFWMLSQAPAAAVAAALLRAAHIPVTSPLATWGGNLLTCNVGWELRHSQYKDLVAKLGERARMFYRDVEEEGEDAAASGDDGDDGSGSDRGNAGSDSDSDGDNGGAAAHTPGTPAATTGAKRPAPASTGAAAAAAAGPSSKRPVHTHGWQVVPLGGSMEAHIAASSSSDDDA